MSADNTVTLVGNATREPDLRFTPSGAANASFGLAVNRRWQNRQTNEWEEETSFFDVICWKELAENVTECVTKGTRVIVTGKLQQRSWETDAGDRRSKIEVVADEIGPSLRWATAQVAKNERRSTSMHGSEAAPPMAPAGGYNRGEEPFCVPADEWWPQVGCGEPPVRMLP